MSQITALNAAEGVCRILKFIPQRFPSQKRSMKSDAVSDSGVVAPLMTSDVPIGADEGAQGKRSRHHDHDRVASAPVFHSSEGARNRNSHKDFFLSRDWDRIQSFWARLVASRDLPSFISGDPSETEYTVCDLSKLHAAGLQEYDLVDNPR